MVHYMNCVLHSLFIPKFHFLDKLCDILYIFSNTLLAFCLGSRILEAIFASSILLLLVLYIYTLYILYISYNCIFTITFTLLNYEPKEEVEEDDMDLSFSPRGPDPRPPLPSMGDFSSPRSLHEPSISDVELDKNSNLTPATSGPKPLSSHVARYPRIKSEGVLRHQNYDPGPLMSLPFEFLDPFPFQF